MAIFGKNEIRKALHNFEDEISSKSFNPSAAKANLDVFNNQANVAVAHINQALTKFKTELNLIHQSMESVSRPEDTKREGMKTTVAIHYDNSVRELYDELKRIKKRFL